MDSLIAQMIPVMENLSIVVLSMAVGMITGLLALLLLLLREPWRAAFFACACILSMLPSAMLLLGGQSLSFESFGSITFPSLLGFGVLGGCFLFPEFRKRQNHQYTLRSVVALVSLAALVWACMNWGLVR